MCEAASGDQTEEHDANNNWGGGRQESNINMNIFQNIVNMFLFEFNKYSVSQTAIPFPLLSFPLINGLLCFTQDTIVNLQLLYIFFKNEDQTFLSFLLPTFLGITET